MNGLLGFWLGNGFDNSMHSSGPELSSSILYLSWSVWIQENVGVFAFYLPKRVGYYKFFSSFCQLYITSKPKIRTSWSRSLIRSWPNYVNWVHDWSLTVIWLLAFKVNVVLPDICPIRPHVQTVLLCVSVSIIYIHPIMRSKKAKALTIWTNSWILYTLTSYPIYPLICGWKKP